MTDKNIKTEGDLNMSENGNSLNNENNDEVDIINDDISEEESIEGSIEEKITEKEEETEESDTITNQEIDSDSDIPEEDEENSDIIDNVADETKTTDNANTEEAEEEDEYFSSIEEIYNFNIDAISSVNSVKSDINRRLMTRKLEFARNNDGFKLMFKILFSFFIPFYIKSCTNDLLSQTLLNYNLVEKGFIFNAIIFILKKLHIIVFLLFTNIGHIFFDILLLFFVEIIDVLVFILDRFDYNIITKEREIRKLKDNKENKDDKNNQDSNKDSGYMMVVINGVLYIFINGILVPLTMFLKSVNKSIAVSSNLFSKIFLSKDDILIKKQPNMDVKKSRLINSLQDKQRTKDKNIDKKRSLFDKLKGKIKEYLDNIVGKNDLLTNSLRGEGKKPKESNRTSRTLGTKEVKDNSRGENTSKGKNKSKSRVKEEEELDGSSKEKDATSKEQGKSDDNSKVQEKSGNNRGEVKEGNKQTRQETITQQGNSIKSNNPNQGVGTNNTTKTSDTVKEPPKPTKQAQNNFDPEKERQRQIDRKELHDLFTKGKVSDDNDNGVGGKFTKEEAQKIAEKVKERNERQQLNKEEDKSKNLDSKEQDRSKQVDGKENQPGKNISEQKGNVGNKKDDINEVKISEEQKIVYNEDTKSTEHKEALAAAEDKKAKMALMRAKVAQAKEKVEQGQLLNTTGVKSTTNPLRGVSISASKGNTQTHKHRVNNPAHKPESNSLPSH